MKLLLIGGTGTISSAVAQRAIQCGHGVTLMNRGSHPERVPRGAELLTVDCCDPDAMKSALKGRRFDAVADFIAYQPLEVQRDIDLFSGNCAQYLFISSASAYQKPPRNAIISEGTPLCNPYWEYSRGKIACEELLFSACREKNFPATIVRPSHTYGLWSVPVAVHGKRGSWQVMRRMLEGKPVIVHGDGLSLWTLTWNEDFARGFCDLLGNPHAVGEAVHITGNEVLTWNSIYQIIGSTLGVTPNLVHVSSEFLAAFDPSLLGSLLGDKANCSVFDNTKIKRLSPGFCAATRFDQGVARTISHILSHPELQWEDAAFDAWCDRVIQAHFCGLRKD